MRVLGAGLANGLKSLVEARPCGFVAAWSMSNDRPSTRA